MKTNELYQIYMNMAQKDLTRTKQEYDSIVTYMKNSTAIHHGEYVRTAYLPKLFTEEDFSMISNDIRTLYGIFEKVIRAYFEDTAYRRIFGFDQITEELILRSNPDLSLLPMARIDFFFNDETKEYKFCEFNTDGSSAMNEDRELHNSQKLSGAYLQFNKMFSTRTCELFDSWVETVLRLTKKYDPSLNDPYVLITDYMECGTVNEFEIFREHFNNKGVRCGVSDIRSLTYNRKEKVLSAPDGNKVDVIYRRAVTGDILKHLEETEDFIDAVKDGAVLLLGDFHTQLIHNKMIFCILHMEETEKLLTDDEIAFIQAHVPITKLFEKEDLKRFDIKNTKDKWIFKPLDSYGSKGVYAGLEYDDPDKWKKVIDKIPETGYILQEFYMPYVTENYGLKDEVFGKYKYYNLTGVYTYDGTAAGVYSRVSLTPIISSQYSEKTIPTLIVSV